MSKEQEIEAFNLKEAFGQQYRVFLDVSWEHELPENKKKAKVWCHEVRGKYGMIYPTSTTGLILYCDSSVVSGKLEKAGFVVYQRGDYETLFKISPSQVNAAAGFSKLKKKRFLSEERKKAQIAVLHAARKHQKSLSNGGSGGPILNETPQSRPLVA